MEKPAGSTNYELILGDSSEYIKKIADHSVDLILTDPPYNLGRYSTGNIKMSWRKDFNNDVAEWDTTIFDPAAWLDDFVRILKPTGTIFAFTSYNLLGQWHQAFDPVFDTFQFIVWHKTNPPPKLRRAGFLNSCELIVCAWNKGHTWNFTKQSEMHNFIESPICMGKERVKNPVHPTQKPIRVLSPLIRLATNPGDLVFDPFMGVGSTGVAAVQLGRRFLGVEIDPLYYQAAERRLATVTPGLFTSESSDPGFKVSRGVSEEEDFMNELTLF
ncbi:MAG: site-specific DNA-methyltransferase [Ktedonobacteraceae bacterium]|nr:site-specific DNA-methyltransferase [Ktedonobacteraceae bacterium]